MDGMATTDSLRRGLGGDVRTKRIVRIVFIQVLRLEIGFEVRVLAEKEVIKGMNNDCLYHSEPRTFAQDVFS